MDAWTPAFGLWHLLGLVSGARLNAKHTAIYLESRHPDVRLRRRIAQRDRVLRGDMTSIWTPAEQAAPVRSAHERTLAP